MKNFIYQPFHLVTLSPWPIVISFNLMIMMMNSIKMFNTNKSLLMLTLLLIFFSSMMWWRDIIRESTFQGFHTIKVINHLKIGMILFIVSEILFFISFFWSYFHMFFSPSIEIGNNWPPLNLTSILINPYNLPLLNTIILISSGMFLSLAHYSMIKLNIDLMNYMMIMTLMFGIVFTSIQLYEYYNSIFMINSSNYGSTFFMMTGFHGIHVLVGTIFIFICYLRFNFMQFSNLHHLNFETSAWYWHFVDVVWLFLFLFIYWWPF